MPHIHHVHLHTGASWRSERTMLDSNTLLRFSYALHHSIEHEHVHLTAGLALRMKPAGRCLTCEVVATDTNTVLATLGVAAHSRCGNGLWRALHRDPPTPLAGNPARQPQVPWCARRIEANGLDAPWTGALDTIERHVAWAWLDHVNTPRA